MGAYVAKILWEIVCVRVCVRKRERERVWNPISIAKRTPELWRKLYSLFQKKIHTQSHAHRAKLHSALHTGFTQAPSPRLWSLNLYVSYTVILITFFSLCTSLSALLLSSSYWKAILSGPIWAHDTIIHFQKPERYWNVSKCWSFTNEMLFIKWRNSATLGGHLSQINNHNGLYGNNIKVIMEPINIFFFYQHKISAVSISH